MRCAMFKMYEMLSHASHRNHAVLCGLFLVGPVLKRFYEATRARAESDDEKEKKEREREKLLLQKLLKRLLEMGAETGEVRMMFDRALLLDGSGADVGRLDMEMLDLLKVGMKSRWMEHFSLEGRSLLAFREEAMKGLPAAGFTFMVRLSFVSFLVGDDLDAFDLARCGCGLQIYRKWAPLRFSM